jgi:hypothetical protein
VRLEPGLTLRGFDHFSPFTLYPLHNSSELQFKVELRRRKGFGGVALLTALLVALTALSLQLEE